MTAKNITNKKIINNEEKSIMPIILSSLFIVLYGLVFLYSLNQDNTTISIGVWGVFSILSYYIGDYFDKNKNNYLGTFFDVLAVAHSYFIVCYLFNVENYFFVNLLFLVVSFLRLVTINRSSHSSQFIFFLVYSFNYYIINDQAQIPLSELAMFNCLFFFLSVSSMYLMKLTHQIKESTLSNLNLLLSIYLVIISSVVTIEYFNGEIPNKSIFAFSLVGLVLYLGLKSTAFLATGCLGVLIMLISSILNIDAEWFLGLSLDLNFDFKLFEETPPEVIEKVTEKVIEVPEIQDVEAQFSFSDINPYFYITPIVIVLLILIIKKVLKIQSEKRARTESASDEVVDETLVEKVETIKEEVKVIKGEAPVTGYYDPIKEQELLEKARREAEERRKRKEEKDFLNPFEVLDDKDDDDFLL